LLSDEILIDVEFFYIFLYFDISPLKIFKLSLYPLFFGNLRLYLCGVALKKAL